MHPDEAAKFFEVAFKESEFWYHYFMLCLMMGVRRAEALAFTWDEESLDTKTMTYKVWQAWGRDRLNNVQYLKSPKNNHERTVGRYSGKRDAS